jgi:hypothetical protein
MNFLKGFQPMPIHVLSKDNGSRQPGKVGRKTVEAESSFTHGMDVVQQKSPARGIHGKS